MCVCLRETECLRGDTDVDITRAGCFGGLAMKINEDIGCIRD